MRHRNYLVACGLDTALAFLERLRFTDEAIAYLRSLGRFREPFFDYLKSFRFTGDVYAIAEGTPVFPDEPILEVVAPIGEAQLVETLLLNQITFQTGIASKASRVVHAAQGRTVADFGMRRMHGWDAAMKAARACSIAGVGATSNVLAAQTYGLAPTGTMAHSYIEAHEKEEDAFRAFAGIYPETTLLVDTYGTLDGVRKVIRLARDSGDAFKVQALRLDSGNLVALAQDARALLDEAGLTDVQLFASNSLDEYAIQDLLEKGAPIDGFGVGTRLGTMADQPYLDSVYKLSALRRAGPDEAFRGEIQPAGPQASLPLFRQREGHPRCHRHGGRNPGWHAASRTRHARRPAHRRRMPDARRGARALPGSHRRAPRPPLRPRQSQSTLHRRP